jgi:hypothetical protein
LERLKRLVEPLLWQSGDDVASDHALQGFDAAVNRLE